MNSDVDQDALRLICGFYSSDDKAQNKNSDSPYLKILGNNFYEKLTVAKKRARSNCWNVGRGIDASKIVFICVLKCVAKGFVGSVNDIVKVTRSVFRTLGNTNLNFFSFEMSVKACISVLISLGLIKTRWDDNEGSFTESKSLNRFMTSFKEEAGFQGELKNILRVITSKVNEISSQQQLYIPETIKMSQSELPRMFYFEQQEDVIVDLSEYIENVVSQLNIVANLHSEEMRLLKSVRGNNEEELCSVVDDMFPDNSSFSNDHNENVVTFFMPSSVNLVPRSTERKLLGLSNNVSRASASHDPKISMLKRGNLNKTGLTAEEKQFSAKMAQARIDIRRAREKVDAFGTDTGFKMIQDEVDSRRKVKQEENALDEDRIYLFTTKRDIVRKFRPCDTVEDIDMNIVSSPLEFSNVVDQLRRMDDDNDQSNKSGTSTPYSRSRRAPYDYGAQHQGSVTPSAVNAPQPTSITTPTPCVAQVGKTQIGRDKFMNQGSRPSTPLDMPQWRVHDWHKDIDSNEDQQVETDFSDKAYLDAHKKALDEAQYVSEYLHNEKKRLKAEERMRRTSQLQMNKLKFNRPQTNQRDSVGGPIGDSSENNVLVSPMVGQDSFSYDGFSYDMDSESVVGDDGGMSYTEGGAAKKRGRPRKIRVEDEPVDVSVAPETPVRSMSTRASSRKNKLELVKKPMCTRSRKSIEKETGPLVTRQTKPKEKIVVQENTSVHYHGTRRSTAKKSLNN